MMLTSQPSVVDCLQPLHPKFHVQFVEPGAVHMHNLVPASLENEAKEPCAARQL